MDVDQDLYGGFLGPGDRRRLNQLRRLSGPELAQERLGFDDERLMELVFRYRARNFPDSLNAQEAQQWQDLRAARLFDGQGEARTVDQLFADLDTLSEDADERAQDLLGALYDYAEAIAPERD